MKNARESQIIICEHLYMAHQVSTDKFILSIACLANANVSCPADQYHKRFASTCFQPAVRQSTVATLNFWAELGGLKEFVEAEIIYDGLKIENPFLRQEVRKKHRYRTVKVRHVVMVFIWRFWD